MDDQDFEEEDDDEEAEYEPDELSKKSRKLRRGDSPSSEADGDGDVGEEGEDVEGIAAWGSKKRDLYNGDQIETEVDALEEEAEAKRLQQKHLQGMREEDFGFDETEWVESGKGQGQQDDGEKAEVNNTMTEVLPQLEIPEDMSIDEQSKVLKSRYPEFEPLAKDFVNLQPTYRELVEAAKNAEAAVHNDDDDDDDDELQPAPVAVSKLRAISAYLGAISMYFVLLSSPTDDSPSGKALPISPAHLRAHPIMVSLVRFRQLWDAVKDISIPEPLDTDGEDDAGEEVGEKEATKVPKPVEETKPAKKTKQPKQKKKATKAQRLAEAEQRESEARRAERLRETEANLKDLTTLVTTSEKKRKANQKAKTTSNNIENTSDFGDDTLTTKEAEEKAKQKRSLRFYTSQLAQKANKRNAAGRDAGGDTDIPYRERLKDRQSRLNAEAEKRGKQKPAKSEELGGESDEEDHRAANELRRNGNDGGSDSDDYYDMVASRSKKKKEDKKARAEAHAAAARKGGHVEVQEEIGPDGKRAITYQIEKNKGLTPKRNKDARNPRVKKRKKFDKKQKKLSSIRPVYKGGESRGGYGGELTGIKKNLVKSVKL